MISDYSSRFFSMLLCLSVFFMSLAPCLLHAAIPEKAEKEMLLKKAETSFSTETLKKTDWWTSVQKRISEQEYAVTFQDKVELPDMKSAYQAPNRAQNLRTYFTEKGIRVISRTGPEAKWQLGLFLKSLQSGDTIIALPQADQPFIDGPKISYERGMVTEWYENRPDGLEQGFVISEEIKGGTRIELEMGIDGNAKPVLAEGGNAVIFFTDSRAKVLRYGGLKVFDAKGKILPSHLALGLNVLKIVIESRDAEFPVVVDPLLTSPAWTAEGDQTDAEYGWSVSTAGDINGDGYSDVVVSAPYYDNGEDGEGKVFVYHGSPSGLSASPNWTAEGNSTWAVFGYSVGAAGDVNGDGYGDVIIRGAGSRAIVYYGSSSGLGSSPDWTNGDVSAISHVSTAGDVNGDGYSDVIISTETYSNGEENEGVVFVYHGSSTGLSTIADWTAEGNQAQARFGNSISTAGDVNGDGYSDVIVGAFQYSNGDDNEGKVFLYMGSSSGLSATVNWTAEGNQAQAYFGFSVSTAGDVNGDGYCDVIIGATGYTKNFNREGRVFIFHGSASGLSVSPYRTIDGGQADCSLGYSVSTAGDVNGDGYADIIIGTISYDSPEVDEGKAFVYFGSQWGVSACADWTAEGNQPNADFARSISTAGDVNGDGFSDIIIGASTYDNGQTNEGMAFVYYGSASGPGDTAGWITEGNQASASFGDSVATAGDVNGDGYSDVIIGSPFYDSGETDEGKVFVFHGASTGLSVNADWSAEGNQASARFGDSVATAGDVNGDGYSDVIVGASYYDSGETNEGKVFVYHGSISGLSPTPHWSAEGNQPNVYLGFSVSTAGDVNGDGFSDVMTGAHYFDEGQADEGKVFVWHGSISGLSPSPDWTAQGDQASAAFGRSVSTAGDVNGDGFSDVIIGSHAYDSGQADEGKAFVYHGSSSGLSAFADWTAEGNQAAALFGWSVSTAGDVNGDGYSDVIIGAYTYDNGETDEGRVFVYHGSETGLSSSPDWVKELNQAAAYFGYAVSTAGDVNGDGFSDVIIGAPFYDSGQTDEGKVFVFHGSGSGLSAGSDWESEVNQNNAIFGNSVSTAGDVNGDGYSEVIAGARDYDSGQTDEGAAFLYFGNSNPGLAVTPRQFKTDDTTSISHLLSSDSDTSFKIAATGRSPMGRSKIMLEWEVKELGVSFDGTGTGTSSLWQDSGVSGYQFIETVSGLLPETDYHWRARFLYPPGNPMGQIAGRWFSPNSNGWEEKDLTTYRDITPPFSPVVSGTTPTWDKTPIWTWTAGGGGNGTYRYKLDDSDLNSGTTQTIENMYTPAVDLSEGAHTLYIQETDAAGNWSNSGSLTIVVNLTDSDGDGMPDLWEEAYGLDPKVDDADGDKDGDRLSNYREYLRGSDPTDPEDPGLKFMPWLPLLLE